METQHNHLDEMQAEILNDCRTLTSECLDSLDTISSYAYSEVDPFIINSYIEFVHNKKIVVLYDVLSEIAGKTHSLKGLMGFIILEGKSLCHAIEDVIKLANNKELIFDITTYDIIRTYLFKVHDLLDAFESGKSTQIYLDSWEIGIEYVITKNAETLGEDKEIFQEFITTRLEDKGDVRKRKQSDSISVNGSGFNNLLEKVTDLYHATLSQQQAGNGNIDHIFNDFVSIHQSIKQTALDLTRYERLVTNLASKNGLKVDFLVEDQGVLADANFWYSIHEILNHIIKNAVVHGIEPPVERLKNGKTESGTITIKIEQDPLNIFITLKDNGRGIDVARLVEKALEIEKFTKAETDQMNREELLQLVFLQGITTKDQLDDDSGRGVGMVAVEHTIQRLDGDCRISSEPDKGSNWAFTFPKKNVSLSSLIVRNKDEYFLILENFVEKIIKIELDNIMTIQEKPYFQDDKNVIPVINLDYLNGAISSDNIDRSLLIIIAGNHGRFGIAVDAVEEKSVMFIRPLEAPVEIDPVVIGASIFRNVPIIALDCSKMNLDPSSSNWSGSQK